MKNEIVNHINVFERKNMKSEKNINKNDEKDISEYLIQFNIRSMI
jgi:hypothetical protein